MASSHNAFLVVGSGPGIGRNTARLFAERGFKQVILMSRNKSRLEEDAAYVREGAPDVRVDTISVDLSELSTVTTALNEVGKKLEESGLPLEAVLHNAARVGESRFTQFPVEEIEVDLRIALLSMYVVAQFAMPRLEQAVPTGRPAFLVTSGLLWTEPFAHLFSLSTCKAAQHNMVESMFKLYAPKGVHCALVVVGGVVKDDAQLTTAKNVALEFWKLYEQPKGQFELETTMLDPEYKALMDKRTTDSQA